VDDLDATVADLVTRGVTADPTMGLEPSVRTTWLTDPDGYRIELGHRAI
jgi:lactoylglutathione lyase